MRYVEARRACEEQEQRIQAIEQHLEKLNCSSTTGGAHVGFLQRLSSARLAAQRQLAQETRTLEQLRQREAEAREQLIREQQALEALEKLREKEFQRFLQKHQQAEARQLDEIAIGQFIRKSDLHV